jgi:uncharacterized membrane protein YtjA (UPF0391 family)
MPPIAMAPREYSGRGDRSATRLREGTERRRFALLSRSRDGTVRSTLGDRNDMPGNLIYYALVLIVIAIVAALFGFGGVASTAMGGAHMLIWVAVVVLVIGVVVTLVRRA